MDYETFIRKLDKDVEDLEQLRRTPLLGGCDVDWDQEVHHLKSVRKFLDLIKNTEEIEDESEQLQAMRGRFSKKESLPSWFRKFRFKNQVRLIKKIGEAEERLKSGGTLDPNDDYGIVMLDSARQQLGYARQEANRKLTEMNFWTKATAWYSSKSVEKPLL